MSRPKSNFTAGYRITIQTANEPRRVIYRKGQNESVARSNAEYISGFIRLLTCEPMSKEEWDAK